MKTSSYGNAFRVIGSLVRVTNATPHTGPEEIYGAVLFRLHEYAVEITGGLLVIWNAMYLTNMQDDMVYHVKLFIC